MSTIYQNSAGASVYDYAGQTYDAHTGQVYVAPAPTATVTPTPAPTTPTSTYTPPAPTGPAPVMPTNTGDPTSYLSSLQKAASTELLKASPNYQYYNSLQDAIKSESTRQGSITSKAQTLVSGGAGSTDINNYYHGLNVNDQSLVKSMFGSNIIDGYQVPTGNVITTSLTPTGPSVYQGPSIIDYLSSVGQPTDFSSRAKLAQGAGITNYSGTADQNTKLLTYLRSSAPVGQVKGASTSAVPVTPQINAISNPVNAPMSFGAAPSLPQPQGAQQFSQYTVGLQASLDAATKALTAGYDDKIKSYQTQLDALDKNAQEIQTLKDNGLHDIAMTVEQETQQKQAALDEEKRAYQENYQANQQLVGELSGLLTQGTEIVTNMKNTTGLASIANPRITQTMQDISGRAGVIQAVMSARNSQIGQAQNQLRASLDAITSISNDQIDYYKSVVNFYDQMGKDNQSQINKLSGEQKTYINAKIGLLEDQVKNAQSTFNIVQNAMLDPNKALAFAKSGVSLTDTPTQISQKLASYEYSQEVSDMANKMAGAGYSSTPISGVTPVTTTDSAGNQQNWYKKAATTGGFTIGNTRFDAAGNPIITAPTTTQVNGGTYTFTSPIKTSLMGAGETSASLTQLQKDISQYGAQYVLDNGAGLSDATVQVLEKEFGIKKAGTADTSGGSWWQFWK